MEIMRSSKAIWIIASALLVLYLASINNEITPVYDSTTYLLLAESLVAGQGYSSIYLAGDPPHATYPYVYPGILAPLVGLFGRSFWVFKCLTALFAFGSLVLCYRLLLTRAGHGEALVIVALVGLHPRFGNFAHSILSEMPFLFFTLLYFLSLERYEKNDRALSRAGALSLLLLVLCIFTRTIGLALLPATLLFLLLSGRKQNTMGLALRKIAFIVTGTGLPVAMWVMRLGAIRSVDPYSYANTFLRDHPHQVGDSVIPLNVLADRFFEGIANNVTHFATLSFNHHYLVPLPGVAWILSALVLIGFVRVLKKGVRAEELYVFFTVAFLLVWPYSYARYLIPLLPFIVRYFLSSVTMISKRLEVIHPGLRRSFLISAVIAVIALSSLASTIKHNPVKEHRTPYLRGPWPDLRAMNYWMKENLEPSSLVMSRYEQFVYWNSGLKCVSMKYGVEPESVERRFHETGPNVLLIDPFEGEMRWKMSLVCLVKKHPDRFQRLHRIGSATLYEVLDQQD
ncbi:ArnT family glycosyltransferase [Acidobacteriota bacterium]